MYFFKIKRPRVADLSFGRTVSYLHLKWEVCLVFNGTLQAHSGGHAHLGNQVVTARVADTRKRVVLAQEAHVQHGNGLPTATCCITRRSTMRAPSGPKCRGQFVLLLHRPCPLPGEVTDERVVRLRLRSRHFGLAPYVSTQAEQLVFTRVYVPLECVFHLLLLRLHFGTGHTWIETPRKDFVSAFTGGRSYPLFPPFSGSSSRRQANTSRSLAHQFHSMSTFGNSRKLPLHTYINITKHYVFIFLIF